MGNTIKKFVFDTCLPFFAKPICILVLILQMAIMDYYLIAHTSQDIRAREIVPPNENETTTAVPPDIPSHWAWYLWVIPDVAVIVLFITAFVKSHKHFKLTASEQAGSVGIGGELPLGYITWLVYSLLMSTKVGIIFRWTAQTLDTDGLSGINLLKFGVSISAVVFLMLVSSHYNVDQDSARESFITLIQHSVTMDLLDTTDILHVILYKESKVTLTFDFHRGIIAVACINLILPTILLAALSKSRFGESIAWQKRIVVIHKIIYQVLVNVPLLILRAFLTHVYKQNVSVFAVKNAIALGIAGRTVAMKLEEAVRAGDATEPTGEGEATEMRSLTGAGTSPGDGDGFELRSVEGESTAAAGITPAQTEGGGERKPTTFI